MAEQVERVTWFRSMDADVRVLVHRVVLIQARRFVAGSTPYGAGPRPRRADDEMPVELPVTFDRVTELVRVASPAFVDEAARLAGPRAHPATVRADAEAFVREFAFQLARHYVQAAGRDEAHAARRQSDLVGALVARLPPRVVAVRAAGLLPAEGPYQVTGLLPRRSDPTLLADVRRHSGPRFPLVAASHEGTVICVTAAQPGRVSKAFAGRAARSLVPAPADSLPDLVPRVDEVLHAARAVAAYRGTEEILHTDRLLPERALCGDPQAASLLVARCVTPLRAAGGGLLTTVETTLDARGVLDLVARRLPAHVNTVRKRLARVEAITGRDPRRPRDALEFQLALIHHRLSTPDPVG